MIGVVGDIRHLGPSTPPRPEIYQPDSQRSFPFMAFVVRTETDPHAIVPALRRAVAELDPTLPLGRTADDGRASGAVAVEAEVLLDAGRPRSACWPSRWR